MAQLAQGFFFDLTNAFFGESQALADFGQGAGILIFQAEVQAKDFGLAFVESVQDFINEVAIGRFADHSVRQCLCMVCEGIERIAVVFLRRQARPKSRRPGPA